MKKIILLLFVLAFGFCGFAQNVTLQASLDTNRILIGEQTTLTLQADGIQNMAEINWPIFPDTLKGIEMISQTRDTVSADGATQIIEKFVLTSFDSGFAVIPPFALKIGNENVETEPLMLHISTVELLADQDLYDIKGPVSPPFDFIYWFKKLWYVSVILALALAVLLWLWLRKKKAKAAVEIPDLRTPAERATDNLNEIKKALYWQHGEVKKHYSEVTDAVRVYVGESTGVNAMEMVSDELLEKMQPELSAEAFAILRKMLLLADSVKFAKMIPGPDQHTEVLNRAFEFVALTTPKKPEKDA